MSDSLIFNDAAAQAVAEFIHASALRFCVAVTDLGHGAIEVTPERPVGTFSEGERYLWALLDDARNGTLQGLAWKCDARNARAVVDLVAGLLGVRFAEVTA